MHFNRYSKKALNHGTLLVCCSSGNTLPFCRAFTPAGEGTLFLFVKSIVGAAPLVVCLVTAYVWFCVLGAQMHSINLFDTE